MAKPHTVTLLTLEPREDVGTTAAHRIRREGKIPGVVYGHGRSTPISIEAKQLSDLILSGEKSKIVEASIGGGKESVLLRRVEAHPISRKALSVDFQRVAQGEAISASVNIVTVGVPIGVSEGGGVMDVITHSLDIKGPAQSIPDSLTVDASGLDVHQHITAGQIALPEGFTLLTPPETVVVSVEITRALASDTAPEAGVAATPAANGDAAPTA
jgi:large subunit ribosomal protein L25